MRKALPILVAGILGIGAIAYYGASDRAPADQPPLATVDPGSLEQLQAQFNTAASETRIVLLLSPT